MLSSFFISRFEDSLTDLRDRTAFFSRVSFCLSKPTVRVVLTTGISVTIYWALAFALLIFYIELFSHRSSLRYILFARALPMMTVRLHLHSLSKAFGKGIMPPHFFNPTVEQAILTVRIISFTLVSATSFARWGEDFNSATLARDSFRDEDSLTHGRTTTSGKEYLGFFYVQNRWNCDTYDVNEVTF